MLLYKTLPRIIWCILGVLLFIGGPACAQPDEAAEVQLQGKRYLDINLRSLDRFERRQQRRQEVLIARLRRKERRLKTALLRKDSLAWQRYNAQGLSMDSIAVLARRDTGTNVTRLLRSSASRLDSLRGVAGFLSYAAGAVPGSEYNAEIDALQRRLEYRKQVDEMLARRTAGLNNLDPGAFPAVKGMQQEIYYAKAQIREYQALADDPGKLEEKAYEFLQGQTGFEERVDGAVNGANPLSAAGGSNLSGADLERMGYQTRRQVGAALQQKFGSNMGAVQQQLGGQLEAQQQNIQKISSSIDDAKNGFRSIRDLRKPDFKINPMKCLPLRQRFETYYDFQTRRAAGIGDPARLTVGAGLDYKNSSKLSAGLGAAVSLGLGENWSAIRLSFEGVSLRASARWELLFGVRIYCGYERTYKASVFGIRPAMEPFPQYATHNKTDYAESVLFGLSKSYKINNRHFGAIAVLYDIWWRDKNLASPFIIRYETR